MEPGGLKSILPKEAFPSVKNKEVTKTDQGEGASRHPGQHGQACLQQGRELPGRQEQRTKEKAGGQTTDGARFTPS